jgi:hypothetical protein
MYRLVHPGDPQELPMRMLFHPVGEGVYLKACEADSFRGLVAALLDAPSYETADLETRLLERLRLADDVILLGQLQERQILVADWDGVETINVNSDEPFIRSLDRLGMVSLEPSVAGSGGAR